MKESKKIRAVLNHPKKTSKLTAVRPSGKKDDSFFELVHEVARQVPKGRVTSYGAIKQQRTADRPASLQATGKNGAPPEERRRRRKRQ